jgi:hypothetical protein
VKVFKGCSFVKLGMSLTIALFELIHGQYSRNVVLLKGRLLALHQEVHYFKLEREMLFKAFELLTPLMRSLIPPADLKGVRISTFVGSCPTYVVRTLFQRVSHLSHHLP